MERTITATEFARTLSDVLNRVRYRGERFVIERNGEPIAALSPAGPMSGITLRELAARLGTLRLPGDGFADDLAAAQASQPSANVPTWPN